MEEVHYWRLELPVAVALERRIANLLPNVVSRYLLFPGAAIAATTTTIQSRNGITGLQHKEEDSGTRTHRKPTDSRWADSLAQ